MAAANTLEDGYPDASLTMLASALPPDWGEMAAANAKTTEELQELKELQALDDAEVATLCDQAVSANHHLPPLREPQNYGGLPNMTEFRRHFFRLIQLRIERNNARTVPYRNSCRLVVDWLLAFMQDRHLPWYLQFEGVDDMTTVELLATDVPVSQYMTVDRMMYGIVQD